MFREQLEKKLGEIAEAGGVRTHDRSGPEEINAADLTIHRLTQEILAANNRPKVGVGVLVFDWLQSSSMQHVLLEKRIHRMGHGDGEYSLPGGWMEHGETFEQTALRELKEETDLDAEGARFVTAVTTTFPSGLHCVTGFVVVRSWFGAMRIVEPEKSSELAFYPVNNLPRPLFGPLETLLRQKVKGGFKSVDFDIDELRGRRVAQHYYPTL